MGNQQSTQHKTQGFALQRFIKPNKHFNTAFLKQLNHSQGIQLIEDLKIIGQKSQQSQNNPASKIFIHTLQFNDDFTFQKTHNRLSSRIGSSHPHIFNLSHFKIQQQKHLCSMSRKMHLCQQGYDFTLKDLMNQKMNRKQSFSEQEVTMIMSKIVQTVIWMNDNQFRNVMLDGEAVLFVKNCGNMESSFSHTLDNYQCKIIDQDIIQTSAYKRFLENLISKRAANNENPIQSFMLTLQIYLSPQLLQQASKQNFYPTNISLKSDIFTLGMLMMQLCCQQEMYFCYNIDMMTLDYESLIHRIAKISYSNDLKLLLAEMLEYDENNRIGFVSLKEKLQKMMLKPFDETRRLKRRSSSTMLKELLSCSRASESVQNNSKPTQKIGQNSRISTVSRSLGKRDEDETSSKIEAKNQVVTHSMRKSNSLVNLKCRTSSFLTSKKLTLMRNPSNTKLETQVKRVTQKEISFDSGKVDYSKILRNRVKTQSKGLECPQGDQKLEESKISQFMRHDEFNQNVNKQSPQTQNQLKESNVQQSQLKHFKTLITDRSIQEDEKIFCGKINQGMHQGDNVNEYKSAQKEKQKQKSQSFSKFTHSFVQKKVINLDKINLNSSQSQKLQKSKSFNISVNKQKENHQLNMNKQDKLPSSQNKSRPKENTIQKTICLQNNSMSSKLLVKQCEKVQNKEVDVSSKNWIIGKLKNKNSLTKKPAESIISITAKDKSSSKKKETSLTKIKTISLQFQQLKLSAQKSAETQPLVIDINLSTQRSQYNSTRLSSMRKNDTIIRGLQLTEEKSYSHEFDQQRQEDQNSIIIQSSIKNQMEMVQKVMEKCVLSSSRWQEDEAKDQSFTRHDNFVKYAEIKQKINSQITNEIVPKASQFKKKSKVIDIDLGKISYTKINDNRGQNPSLNLKERSLTKNDKKTTSKLQKLKQLTIFTDEDTITQDNNNEKITTKLQKIKPYNDDKQNNMQNSNRQALGQSDLQKLSGAVQNLSKQRYLNSNYQPQSLNYLQIPYQRIQYVNFVATTSLMTPSNMNDLNKIYGNGMTVESIGQSLHRKEYSTLSKPFQEIELDFAGNSGPEITSPHLAKQNDEESFKNQFKKHTINIKENEMFSINNSEELTFRVKSKPQIQDQLKEKSSYFKETFHPNPQSQSQPQPQSEVQKVNYFQRNDGSFVMRQQNPIKSIQTSSIIGQEKNKLLMPRNTVEELFKESTSKFNTKQFQSLYQGYKESFYEQGDDERMKKSEIMDSSCNSINLSQIQHTAQKGESFLFPSSQIQRQKQKIPSPKKQRKLKQISILQPYDQPNDRSRDLSINLKNIKQQNELQKIQSNRDSEYNTYRRYLSSNNQFTSRVIELDDNFVYEGQVNTHGEFEGNGMISRRDYEMCLDVLVYTGSFVNGRYHGFGTLYQIENAEDKIVKLPNKRISFGAPNNGTYNDKYFQLSQRPIKYEGQFCDGTESGFGTYYYQNGDKFSGCIKNGKIEGYGTYNFADNGQVISGIWRNNVYTDY